MSAWHREDNLSLVIVRHPMSRLARQQDHTFDTYNCEAQARVRQGSARDGPARQGSGKDQQGSARDGP